MLLNIKVIAKSSRQLVKEEASGIKVYVRTAPENGKANKAVIELLAEYFKVAKKDVRIIKGFKSPLKTIEINRK